MYKRQMAVFRVFGPSAMQAISQNPYLLCGEPLQLDFRHADSIAQYYHMEGAVSYTHLDVYKRPA